MPSNFSKDNLRKQILKKRLNLDKDFVKKATDAIYDKLLLKIKTLKSANILIYLPVNNEVGTRNIIDSLISEGKQIFLPRHLGNSPGVSNALGYTITEFTGWQNLEPGPFGILQPSFPRHHKSPIRHPELARPERSRRDSGSLDVAIIPGLAFDKRGARLGYGKGVFDRLLADSPAYKIGLAYDFQIVAELPREKHDLVMDLVVTEKRVIVRSS